MKNKARRILTFLFAALHLLANIFSSAAYALGDTGRGSARGDSAPGAGTASSRAKSSNPPLSRSMKSVDTIKVPSPAVTPHDWKSFEAVEAHATGDVSRALNGLDLTPAQRISVRNYIGQYDEKYHVVAGVAANGVQTLGIRDAKTGDYVGAITLKRGADGGITVDKAIAATLDTKHTLEIPIAGKVNEEEARQVLGSSSEYDKLKTEESKPKLTASLPALKAEAGADFAKASESTAHFNPDGSGYEYGLNTKVASGKIEGKAGLSTERTTAGGSGYAGVEGGAGAKGPEVEGFVNYFGKPDVDAKGQFSRSVVGGSIEFHATLAQVEAKLGCDSEKGCGTQLSAGALGGGAGTSVTFSTHLKIPVRPVEEAEIQEGGVASREETAPEPAVPAAEEKAYEDAVKVGTPAALNGFLAAYPNSDLADEVLNKADLSAAGEPMGLCEDFDKSGACGRAGY